MEEQNPNVQQSNAEQSVQPQQVEQSVPVEQGNVTAPNEAPTQSPAPTPQAPKKPVLNVSQEEKVWGLLAYLPLLALATLVLKPKSDFCRFHGAQGLVLFGLEFLMVFVSAISPTIGGLLLFVVLIVAVFGAVKAFVGEQFRIPVISEVAKMIPVDSLVAGVVGPEAMKKPEQDQSPVETGTVDANDTQSADPSNLEEDQPVPPVVDNSSQQAQVEPTPPARPEIPSEPVQPAEPVTPPVVEKKVVPPVVSTPDEQVEGGDSSSTADGNSNDVASSGE